MTAIIHIQAIAWGTKEEYHKTTLHIPSLSDGQWRGWAWCKVLPTWIEAQAVDGISGIDSTKRVHLLLLKETSSGKVVCVYPLSTFSATTIVSRQATGLVLEGRRIDSSATTAEAGCVIGTAKSARDIHALIEQCVSKARLFVAGDIALSPLREGSWQDGPFGGIGFCTWSSLGEDIRPDHANMTDLLEQLARTRIPVRSFILDDGWHQQKTYRTGDASPYRCLTGPEEKRNSWELRGLWGFDAHAELHPAGLAGTVDQIKRALGSECEVGVWLALTGGYWDGVHPESPLIERYSCQRYPTSRQRLGGTPNVPFTPAYIPDGKGELWLPPPSSSLRYWREWFARIRACGATFLKVDVQAALVVLDGQSGAECQTALWENMLKASDEIFGKGRVIHCMSQSEGMFGGVQGLGLSTDGEKIVWRNSDDFGLVGKKNDVQQQHIFTNLTNSLLTNHLALIPDPDMFMTADQAPFYHALLRVMYPGPLLLSDRPGHHDLDLIGRMTSRDTRGITQVVRARDFARPLATRILDIDLLGHSTGKGLWASSRTECGAAIISVWNVRSDTSNASVKDALSRIDLADALDEDIVRDMVVIELSLAGHGIQRGIVLSSSDTEPIFDIVLGNLGAACFWALPVHSIGRIRVVLLGAIDKLAGVSILRDVIVKDTSIDFSVDLEGTLGFIVLDEEQSLEVTVDGTQALLSAQEGIAGVRGKLYTTPLTDGRPDSLGWSISVRPL